MTDEQPNETIVDAHGELVHDAKESWQGAEPTPPSPYDDGATGVSPKPCGAPHVTMRIDHDAAVY